MGALEEHARDRNATFPPMHHAALAENYPGTYQSLLQIVHTTGERVQHLSSCREEK